MVEESLRKYLPTFNKKGEVEDFYSGIKEIIKTGKLASKDFFSTYGTLKEPILDQGDCIDNMPIFNLPNTVSKSGKGFILSNVCDISEGNKRTDQVRVLYAPLLNFDKYIEKLKENKLYNKQKEDAIKSQQVTTILFVPRGGGLEYDAFVPLDQVISIPRSEIATDTIRDRRVFQLSRTAWYLLLMKITHHFARSNNELFENRSPSSNP